MSKKGKVKPAKFKRVWYAGQRDLAPVQLSGAYERRYVNYRPDWWLEHQEILARNLAARGIKVSPPRRPSPRVTTRRMINEAIRKAERPRGQ